MPAPSRLRSAIVGNDVVDLTADRVRGKERDARFLRRIFTHEERDVILTSRRPALDLWGMWAAKEAAFKILSKQLGTPPPFEHASFETVWSDPTESPGLYGPVARAGVVRHPGGFAAAVSVSEADGALTALALAEEASSAEVVVSGSLLSLTDPEAEWAAQVESLMARLTAREAEPVHSHASAAVRVGARTTLAAAWGIDDRRIEIVCDPGPTGRRPPRILLDGMPCEADVSLSHDGPWIAWALAYRQKPAGL